MRNLVNSIKRFSFTKHLDEILKANAILYPDKIVVETMDTVKEGFSITSSKISILPFDIDTSKLGSTIRHHLNLTEINMTIPKDYKQHYSDYLKQLGLKMVKYITETIYY
jgi:hypothetical protein